MPLPKTRLFAKSLFVTLVASVNQSGFAQEQVTVTVPASTSQPAVDTAKPETPNSRKAGKSKYVLPLPKEYESRDKNGDGQIALYEWERSKYAEFFKLDKNGDGFLTPQELTPKTASTGARMKIGSAPDKDALPNPGNLVSYNQKIGETITFTVTGQTKGSIWGAGTYTTDSDLATVAVHAGILKDGETGSVRVTITAPPTTFGISTANGVTSSSRAEVLPAAFTVH